MARMHWLFLALLLALPSPARAIALNWASAGSNLDFAHTTQCTLLVTADVDESGLAKEWRLLWVARGCPELNTVVDSLTNDPDVGEPAVADQPSLSEQDGHIRTVHFSSPNGTATRRARIHLTLPAGSSGNFQVVELNSSSGLDSPGRLKRSAVVTFNGGVSRPMPPAILEATSVHATSQLSVTLRGAGLGTTTAVSLGGPDRSWQQELEVVVADDSTLTATADVPVALPNAFVNLSLADSTTTSAALAGDVLVNPPIIKGNSWLVVPEDPNYVIPKDFAFVYNTVPTGVQNLWKNLFHIIYIRQFVHPVPGLYDENSFGHIWSDGQNDLSTWHVDTLCFKSGAVGFDKLHVWAPSIVQNGNQYHMFYTGVDSANDQRLMRVSSFRLDAGTRDTAWTNRGRTVVHTALNKSWGLKAPTAPPQVGREIRDPYVFPDPDSAGRILMLYTSRDSFPDGARPLAVGLARNQSGTMSVWTDIGRYLATTRPAANIGQLESPHVFPDSTSGNSGWRLMFTEASGNKARRTNSLQFISAGALTHVSDLSASAWSVPDSLAGYLAPDTTVRGWVASEQLRAGKIDFLAAQNAYNFDGIHISRMYWTGSNFQLRVPSIVSVDHVGSRVSTLQLALRNYSPERRLVEFAIRAPSRLKVRLDLYDVMGRRIATLIDRPIAAGETTVRWDGASSSGISAQSGMYFANLSFAGGTRSASFSVIR